MAQALSGLSWWRAMARAFLQFLRVSFVLTWRDLSLIRLASSLLSASRLASNIMCRVSPPEFPPKRERETNRIIQESSHVLKAFAAMRFSSRPEQLHFSEGDSIDFFGRKNSRRLRWWGGGAGRGGGAWSRATVGVYIKGVRWKYWGMRLCDWRSMSWREWDSLTCRSQRRRWLAGVERRIFCNGRSQ